MILDDKDYCCNNRTTKTRQKGVERRSIESCKTKTDLFNGTKEEKLFGKEYISCMIERLQYRGGVVKYINLGCFGWIPSGFGTFILVLGVLCFGNLWGV